MTRRILISIILPLLLLSGCTLEGYRGVRTEEYPALRRIFDVTVGWKKSIDERGMSIEGYARNTRYFIIRDLELRIALVARDGREKARETFLFVPSELREGELAPFSVTLKARPQAGDRLRFIYSYRFSEGGDRFDGNGGSWMNSFEVDALE